MTDTNTLIATLRRIAPAAVDGKSWAEEAADALEKMALDLHCRALAGEHLHQQIEKQNNEITDLLAGTMELQADNQRLRISPTGISTIADYVEQTRILRAELAESRKESEEQARLLGMSGSREAKLLTDLAEEKRKSLSYQKEAMGYSLDVIEAEKNLFQMQNAAIALNRKFEAAREEAENNNEAVRFLKGETHDCSSCPGCIFRAKFEAARKAWLDERCAAYGHMTTREEHERYIDDMIEGIQ